MTSHTQLTTPPLQMRVGLRQCGDLLGRHAHQFRAIQKRLLSRYKDKTPVGLSHMDTLLDGTYMQVGVVRGGRGHVVIPFSHELCP